MLVQAGVVALQSVSHGPYRTPGENHNFESACAQIRGALHRCFAACKQFAHRIPLLANMVEGGKTPVQSATDLGARGFKIVIFPGGTVRAVTHTLQGYYASLHQHQITSPWQADMLDFDGLNEVIETPQLLALGQKYK